MGTSRMISGSGRDFSLDDIYWIFNHLCTLHNAPNPDRLESPKIQRKYRYHILYTLICRLLYEYHKVESPPDHNPAKFFEQELKRDASPLGKKFMHSQWGEQDTDLLLAQDKNISRIAEFVGGYVTYYQSLGPNEFVQRLEGIFRSTHSKLEFHEQIGQLSEGSWACVIKRCDCGPKNPDCVLAKLA